MSETKTAVKEKPKTAQSPKSSPTSVKGTQTSEQAWKIILYPMLTEKSIGFVETQNRLMFCVRQDATKRQIRWAVENALGVKVETVNTLIDRDGKKRAMVKLSKDFKAADIATRFGML